MARKDDIDRLKSVALFGNLSGRELQRVARAADSVSITAGTQLIDQGDVGREAYVVVTGELDIRRNGRKIAGLGPGESVGEISLFDHGPRTAAVIALTDCDLLVIRAQDLRKLIDDTPALANKLLASMAERIRDLDRKIVG